MFSVTCRSAVNSLSTESFKSAGILVTSWMIFSVKPTLGYMYHSVSCPSTVHVFHQYHSNISNRSVSNIRGNSCILGNDAGNVDRFNVESTAINTKILDHQ